MATIDVVRDGAVVRISLARPPMNILDRPLNRALATAVHEHSRDPDVAVIVLDGGTARGFSSGVEVADHTPDKVEGMLSDFHAAIRELWAAPCPSIAAVHGFAMGGGFELALACDMVVVESDARLGFPEIALGCYPPAAAAILPTRAGWAVASELVLTGEDIDAARAREAGLVNRVCKPGRLKDETQRLTDALLAKSPAVLREAKRALREGAEASPRNALARIENGFLGTLMQLEDAQEGINAFLEKREPRFRNR